MSYCFIQSQLKFEGKKYYFFGREYHVVSKQIFKFDSQLLPCEIDLSSLKSILMTLCLIYSSTRNDMLQCFVCSLIPKGSEKKWAKVRVLSELRRHLLKYRLQRFQGTGRPAVPLSRDKDISLVPLSLCPGARAGANVPRQNRLSRDVPGQK